MSGAGFGQAGLGFFLDPGDQLVGLEVVGQALREGRSLVKAGALQSELGGSNERFLGGLDLVGQGGDFRLGGRRVSLALVPLGLDDVGFVLADGRREELRPAVACRQLAQGVLSLFQGLLGALGLLLELLEAGLQDVALGGGGGDFGVEPGSLLLDLLLLRLGLPEFSFEAVGLRLLLFARDAGLLEPLLGAAGRGFGLLQARLDGVEGGGLSFRDRLHRLFADGAGVAWLQALADGQGGVVAVCLPARR